MKLNLWLYLVYRVNEQYSYDSYDDGSTAEFRTPIAGYEEKEKAAIHAEKAQEHLRKRSTANPWDPFLDPNGDQPASYRVGVLPLIVLPSVSNAPEVMKTSIAVLRDMALETANKSMLSELPPIPIKYPLWSITGNSISKIEHYFDGKPNHIGRADVSLCGNYLSARIVHTVGTRQCLVCLKFLKKQAEKPPLATEDAVP